MKHDIDTAKQLGADGIVLGLLTAKGLVDIPNTRMLVERARPLAVTFHRAFDMTVDPIQAYHDLASIDGITRILTSGAESSVLEGLPLLKTLFDLSNGRAPHILPGCGITLNNLPRILKEVPFEEVHMAIPKMVPSQMGYKNDRVYMGVAVLTPEYEVVLADGDVIRKVSRVLKG